MRWLLRLIDIVVGKFRPNWHDPTAGHLPFVLDPSSRLQCPRGLSHVSEWLYDDVPIGAAGIPIG